MTKDIDEPADVGGLPAVVVACGFTRYGYGLFVPVFREELGLPAAAVDLVSSVVCAAYLLMIVLTGFLRDGKPCFQDESR